MVEYLYFSTYVEFRIPINEDGTTGNPEVTKKFTNPMKNKGTGAKKDLKKPKKEVKTKQREVEYL